MPWSANRQPYSTPSWYDVECKMVSRPLCQNGFEPIKMIKMYFEDVERGFRLAWHKTPTLFESNNTRPVSCWFIWLFGNWQQRSNSLNSRKWRMRIRGLGWYGLSVILCRCGTFKKTHIKRPHRGCFQNTKCWLPNTNIYITCLLTLNS